jgi:hypothetical protein
MAKDKTDKSSHENAWQSTAPTKVWGLLDAVVAEANGEPWVLNDSDPLAGMGLGLGASPEAKRLLLIGLFTERLTDIEKQLAKLKPERGRPKSETSIDVKRAAAVLGANDLWRETTGRDAPTQKAAIELAVEIDVLLCGRDESRKPIFGNMTSMKRWQDSVSNGLREMGDAGAVFIKSSRE